ncbi:MAG: phytoene desaturase [Anaerolineales bacterium]|nr:phytoene desaturase [Anaerolineales bacterium]
MKKKIIIIGSGFGGLGAAARLAAKGHEVQLFEKRDKLGGRAYVYEINGFKFDGGPTVITAPYTFDEIFAAAGRRREDYFKLVPLDPFYRVFDHHGHSFDYHRDPAATLAQIDRWNPDDKAGYQDMVEQNDAVFWRYREYTEKPCLKLADMLPVLPDAIKKGSFLGMHRYVSQFIQNDFLRRVFSFHPLLIGGSPFDTPSFYALIQSFERHWGVHYAMGGTGAIVEAFGRLLAELGVTIHFKAEVAEILINQRRASGIRLIDGTVHYADDIISNADVAFTYRHLIPAEYRRKYTNRKIEKMKYSMSLFVIYFGTKRRYTDSALSHHNLIVNQRYKGLLDDIFKKQRLPEDLCLYLHMPTLTDPSIAPPGCELFYVLSPVPHLGSGTDWTQAAAGYRDKIMQFLEDNYLPDLQANIIAEHFIDPLHFQNTLNSYQGAAFSIQPTLFQSAWFRPRNRSEEFANLYFVGAGTHPGAGVPAVLASGKIAAELIDPTPALVKVRSGLQPHYFPDTLI